MQKFSSYFFLVVILIAIVACAQQPRPKSNAPNNTPADVGKTVQSSGGEARGSTASDFSEFWTAFRAAALANDKEKVASMTKFPFPVHGTLDSSPSKSYDKAGFLKLFDTLMQQDPGLNPEPDTMRHYLERHPRPAEKDVRPGGTSARAANFEFQNVGGKWMFTTAYVED